ncbi:MAG: hypothetical protein AAF351_06310 [Pseudomonadota bacterium]
MLLMGDFFEELKRRNVVRVGIAYVVFGWVVLQAADVLLGLLQVQPIVGKTVAFVLLLGFPVVCFVAWVYELTSDGLKKTEEVDESKSLTHSTGRKLDFAIIAALVVALSYFIWERQVGDGAVIADKSIAVLPFVNLSADADQEWVADGLTEELLNALAKTPDVRVASRIASFQYKGKTDDIRAIAERLGVAYVIEGSVRRSGERLRVTAQLIEAADGFHLWSETYDRTPEDIIAIQEDVAVEIASALQTAMDPEALAKMMSVGTQSVSAYEAYLKGNALRAQVISSGDYGLLTPALASWEEAAAIDPQFAAAHIALARFWLQQMFVNSKAARAIPNTAQQRLARFRESIASAIASSKDPLDTLRYQAIEATVALRFHSALQLTDRYLEQRPNDLDVVTGKRYLVNVLGRVDDGIANAYRMAELGRDDPLATELAITSLAIAGEVDGAAALAQRSLNRFPGNNEVAYQAHRAFIYAGKIDEARALLPSLRASGLSEDSQLYLTIRQACAEGDTATAVEAMQRMEELLVGRDPAGLIVANFMLGTPWKNEPIVRRLDDAGQIFEIASFMGAQWFDPRPYPNLMAVLEREGAVIRDNYQDAPTPYRCDPSQLSESD